MFYVNIIYLSFQICNFYKLSHSTVSLNYAMLLKQSPTVQAMYIHNLYTCLCLNWDLMSITASSYNIDLAVLHYARCYISDRYIRVHVHPISRRTTSKIFILYLFHRHTCMGCFLHSLVNQIKKS